jgi:EmrB/QacA subfamily drug resistance transporter
VAITTSRHRLITEQNSRWWTLGAMCVALFMMMLDNTVVNVALPSIERDLHASLSSLEWTVNAYTLALAVGLITAGRLGDIFGRRRLFIIGVTIFGISSLVIGLAPNVGVMIVFRAVQGIGGACMMPASLAIVTNAFPREERGTAIGTWAGVSALALAIGPVVGGFLTEYVSWRAIFFINPPIAVIAVFGALFAAHESRDETVDRSIDYAGVALLTTGLLTLVLALIEGNSWGWGSVKTIGLLAVAVLALVGFVVLEPRVRVPMIDFAVFRSRTSVGVNIVGLIVSFAMFAQIFFITFYMQNVMGLSPLATGVRFLPATMLLVVFGPISGRLTDRIGPRPLMVAGIILLSAATFIQSRITVSSGYLLLLPGFVLLGCGMGLVMSPLNTAAMNAVDRAKAGAAGGVLSTSRMVGGSFGVAVMGAIVTTVGRSQLDQSLPHLPQGERGRIASALGSGGAVGAHSPAAIVSAVQHAFVSALSTGLVVCSVVTLAGAVVAWVLIEPKVAAPGPVAPPVPASG